mgnify:CR=1 FL=1
MGFCRNCGAELPDGANFCSRCGAKVAVKVGVVKADYSGVGAVLVLVGGILAVAFSVFTLLVMPFFLFMGMGWSSIMGRQWELVWSWPTGLWSVFAGLIIVGFVVAIIAGIVSIFAYTRVRAGEVKEGGLAALVTGAIMLITMNWFPGVITILGGALCYSSR